MSDCWLLHSCGQRLSQRCVYSKLKYSSHCRKICWDKPVPNIPPRPVLMRCGPERGPEKARTGIEHKTFLLFICIEVMYILFGGFI